jgi:hypothetical protein
MVCFHESVVYRTRISWNHRFHALPSHKKIIALAILIIQAEREAGLRGKELS